MQAKGSDDEFVVVLDAGHGGKDFGASENGAHEKDINLSVVRKVGELLTKKMKNVKVVYTRDNDTFVTLQGRADIANKSKADLFVSIHTNSVDKSNKNRVNVSGASVYALGLHKDDNNMNVARRENSVIEMEGNYEQKYSGFDPSKDESYIIFEMAQKKNLAQSIKFAHEVQRNMVSIADRKDRGVHQAGFWVLWATSMPSVLIELDFICNPESAKFMTSKAGVDKMAEAIYKAIRSYEEKYVSRSGISANSSRPVRNDRSVDEIMSDSRSSGLIAEQSSAPSVSFSSVSEQKGSSRRVYKDTSHQGVLTDSRNGRTARRRRSQQSAATSAARNVEVKEIALLSESDGGMSYSAIDDDKGAVSVVDDTGNDRKVKKAKGGKQSKKERKQPKSGVKTRNKMQTVYTIQIMASAERLNGSYQGFCGLSPIYSFRENNLYKYTYGEAKTKEEIEPLLVKVREKIPDAFIISKTRSM
ncbi:MAG: N-acetylmuramoyl-L-alanine amidase [Muribaculaceae bacterium]|nr:N-acetylmuramoyl-L-alanine amidase [Muribaculaceae bacterium]